MQYIYARVSVDQRTTDNQVHHLKKSFPEAQIWTETASGAKNRPILQKLLKTLQSGDMLIVAALDRLGRKTSEVLALIEDLEERDIILKSIREGIDYSTPTGRLVTQILCSVAEMERNLIAERTKQALAAKKAGGAQLGRPKQINARVINKVRSLREKGLSIRDIAKKSTVSKSTVANILKEA